MLVKRLKTVGRVLTIATCFSIYLLFLDWLDIRCYFISDGSWFYHVIQFVSFTIVKVDLVFFAVSIIGALIVLFLQRREKNRRG